VDVEERLVVVEGEVAGQRQDLGLPLLGGTQVGFCLRVEVADDRGLDRPDAREVAGHEFMRAGKRQQALHHFLARAEFEEVRSRVSVTEEGGFR